MCLQSYYKNFRLNININSHIIKYRTIKNWRLIIPLVIHLFDFDAI